MLSFTLLTQSDLAFKTSGLFSSSFHQNCSLSSFAPNTRSSRRVKFLITSCCCKTTMKSITTSCLCIALQLLIFISVVFPGQSKTITVSVDLSSPIHQVSKKTSDNHSFIAFFPSSSFSFVCSLFYHFFFYAFSPFHLFL